MMAARLSPGAISESSSSHLPPSEASLLAKPVMFPPGRSSRGTMLLATGSATFAKTIGIVRVSRWTATVAGVPFVRTISGFEPTNSCASAWCPINVITEPSKVHAHVAAIGPTQVRKRLRERREARLPHGMLEVQKLSPLRLVRATFQDATAARKAFHTIVWRSRAAVISR